MKAKTGTLVVLTGLLACAAMAWVDGFWQPGYALKSAVKVALFLLLPALVRLLHRDTLYREVFHFRGKGLALAAALGIGLYGAILGGYLLLRPWLDLSAIAGKLTENAGVTRENFLYVSLYISFVNSLLEEFFFRGFLFANLKREEPRFARWFCCLLFALYHAAMMVGWFPWYLFLLALVGLAVGGGIFHWLNEKLGCIYGSWLVHMGANFAINTIGFWLLNG